MLRRLFIYFNFNVYYVFTGDPYTQDTVTVLEKIAIQTQLYLAIDTIQDALGTLARNVKRWTR